MSSNYGLSFFFRDSSKYIEEISNEIQKFQPEYVFVDDETPPNEDCFVFLNRLMSRIKKNIAFGTSITNPFSRHPLCLAFKVLSMINHFNTNFILGIGNGSFSRRKALGIESVSFKQEMFEAIEIIKSLWEGNLVNFKGDFFNCHSQIQNDLLPPEIPKIWLAARGPNMLDFSTKLADGVFGAYYPFVEYQTLFKNTILNGLKNQEKDLDNFTCAMWFPIYTKSTDEDKKKIQEHCIKRWKITPVAIKKLLKSENKTKTSTFSKLVVHGEIEDCIVQIKKWTSNFPIIPFFAINELNFHSELIKDINEIVSKI